MSHTLSAQDLMASVGGGGGGGGGVGGGDKKERSQYNIGHCLNK